MQYSDKNIAFSNGRTCSSKRTLTCCIHIDCVLRNPLSVYACPNEVALLGFTVHVR